MLSASVISTGFSVVTTLPRSIPIIEDLALRYGMERKCRSVRAADIPVLDLKKNNVAARKKSQRKLKLWWIKTVVKP